MHLLLLIIIFLIVGVLTWNFLDSYPVLAIVFILIVIVVKAYYREEHKNEMAYKKREEERKRKRMENDRKRAEDAIEKRIGELTRKYGRVSNMIVLDELEYIPDIKRCLLFFGESKLVYVDGKAILFKDIISYNITDDFRIRHGKSEYESLTTTSTGDLLGRSAAGGLIAGNVGAVIGASSAKRRTITIENRGDDMIEHNYTLSINVKSLEYPLLRVELGDSIEKKEEVNAAFACIMFL